MKPAAIKKLQRAIASAVTNVVIESLAQYDAAIRASVIASLSASAPAVAVPRKPRKPRAPKAKPTDTAAPHTPKRSLTDENDN